MSDERYETLDYQEEYPSDSEEEIEHEVQIGDKLYTDKAMAQASITWAWVLNPIDTDDTNHHCIQISHPNFDGTIIRLNNIGVIGDDPHPETGEVHPKAGRLYVDYDIIAVEEDSRADRTQWRQEEKEEFEEVVEHIAIQILARDGLDRANNPEESIN